MNYLISPPEETVWRMNESLFIEKLKERWLNIEIKRIHNAEDTYSVVWNLEMEAGRFDGALARDDQTIGLDSDIRNCGVFAVWVRTLVPQEQPLIFYDQGYSAHIDLDASTSAEEIVRTFWDI